VHQHSRSGGIAGRISISAEAWKIHFAVPSGIRLEQAIAHNKTGERLDGVDLESDVKLVGKAHRALAGAGFEYAQGFPLSEWHKVLDRMIALRDRLRRKAA
jgi:hypothetical protein